MKSLATTVMAKTALLFALAGPTHAQNNQAPVNSFKNLPERPTTAMSGQEFMNSIKGLNGLEREQVIVREILSGNFPDFLRLLKPVSFKHKDWKGRVWTLTTFVMPDYLAVGSNKDYVRVPLNLFSAKTLTRAFNFSLPTKKMVNAIYRQAEVKLTPRPMRPGPLMTSSAYFQSHNNFIQGQLRRHQPKLGTLVAGHKKDVVQSRKLTKKPRAIAIFGWHKLNHKPIQPLSTVHGAGYADYSHGIRLVSNWAYLKLGHKTELVNIEKILQGRYSWRLVSDEGPMPPQRMKLSRR